MNAALEQARRGAADAGVPIGGVVFDARRGRIVAQAHNTARAPEGRRVDHAEMNALRDLPDGALADAANLTLVSTLEPCVMCLGGAIECGIGRVVYAVESPINGGIARVDDPARLPEIRAGVRRDAALAMLREWAAAPGNRSDFITRLLRSIERAGV